MRRTAAGLIFGVGILAVVGWTAIEPSNDRAWPVDQRRMPTARFHGDSVTIEDVRAFAWHEDGTMDAAWDVRTYDLSTITSVWYVLTPFSRDNRGPAHAFVSFGFADGRYVSISVEARREEGEQYSILRGLLKRFEIMYVVGDESDLIHLRVLRGDDVHVYPMRATASQMRALLTGMLERANQLHARPEFYGTLRNNCTTNLLAHVNTLAAEPIPWGRRILLPGYSDEVAHERGLIDTDLPLDAARSAFLVNERALRATPGGDYSRTIRATAYSPVIQEND